MSSQVASASNKESVAAILSNRGFDWLSFDIEKVQYDSYNISFSEEWTLFASLVAAMTVGNKTPLDPETAWKDHFQSVITNPGKPDETDKPHGSEDMFKKGLFEALRNSLNGFVHPITSKENNRNLILLQCSDMNVGFGKEVNREKLGFNEGYGLSKKSQPDHGCFIFGSKKRQSAGSDEKYEIHDMTAAVELKLEKSSCMNFTIYQDGETNEKVLTREINPPIFEGAHAPMGQAMLYSMDVWHCLARRGVSVSSIPVVMLAAKSELQDDAHRICCLEARIQIPKYCGQYFVYSVNRIVSFDGTIGLPMKDGNAEKPAACADTRDKRAIAIYIRTMRVGLERANQINKKKLDPDTMDPPVSLCCHQLFKRNIMGSLIASPIPDANSFQECTLRVKQGELFQLSNPEIEDFAGLSNMQWFINLKVNHEGVKVDVKLPENCLAKVSCASVHNTSVSHLFSEKALTRLHGASEKLKNEVSKVLLGFCHTGESGYLITIMKDLRLGEEKFQILEHHKYRQDGKLSQLWTAFCVLVKSLLLPMADVQIIHLDIRSDTEITHNILVCENTKSVDKDPASIEMCLIDFESLAVAGSTSGSRQTAGVYWKDLKKTVSGEEWESAHRYLFWQVLWIAYTWYPPSSAFKAQDAKNMKRSARTFVELFSMNEYCEDFKEWLNAGTVQSLKIRNEGTITAETIKETLDDIGEAFSRV